MIMLASPAGRPFEVARVRSVPVSIGQSWPYLLVGLLVVLVADSTLSSATLVDGVSTALLWWVCLLAAVLIHEAGHVLMALALRVPVRPVVIDIWAGHVTDQEPLAGRAMLVAIAGPFANLATSVIAYYNRDVATWSLTVVPFMVLNLGLFIYHVLPGLPQDGGHVVSGVVKWVTQSATSGLEVAAWSGRFVIIAAAGLFLVAPITLGKHLPRLVDLVWVALVVALLWRSTTDVLRRVRRRHLTDQITTRSITRPSETVPRHTRLDIVDATFVRGTGVIVLGDDDEPVGVLVVGAGPQRRRDVVTAGDAMLPAPGRDWVCEAALDEEVSDAADALVDHAYPVVAVRTETGRYGLLWRADLDSELYRRGSIFGPRRARLDLLRQEHGSQP